MTTDHEQLLKMRRLLREAAHIGRQVRAQLLQFDTPRAKGERDSLTEIVDETEQAKSYLEDYILEDSEAAPIELADLCEFEE